jgi:hypothetical protein
MFIASTHWIEVDFIAVSATLGFVLPLVINFLKDNRVLTYLGFPEEWTPRLKQWFAIIASAVTGFVLFAAENGWTGIGWTELNVIAVSSGTIFALMKTTYDGFWKTSKWGMKLRVAGATERPPLPSQGNPDFGDDEEGEMFG